MTEVWSWNIGNIRDVREQKLQHWCIQDTDILSNRANGICCTD